MAEPSGLQQHVFVSILLCLCLAVWAIHALCRVAALRLSLTMARSSLFRAALGRLRGPSFTRTLAKNGDWLRDQPPQPDRPQAEVQVLCVLLPGEDKLGSPFSTAGDRRNHHNDCAADLLPD
jgi:hypothetical protein